ncbi:MAG: iron transporter [Candidatus Limnocylindrales bacterium]
MASIIDPTKSGRPSDESTSEQLALARAQGETYGTALAEMAKREADDGDQIQAGDLLVAYAIEEAEGLYRWVDGQLRWQNPTDENVHVEIAVRDAHDGRFVPGLDVTVSLTTLDGEEVGAHQQPFLWHPWLHHYGRNWQVPGDGEYRLAVHIRPAEFMRHDKENGDRFAQPVDVEWPSVRIETGQKRS